MTKCFIILIFFISAVYSATYYVSGNDTDHGKYDLRIKDLNNLIEKGLSTGDTVLFKRGERFFYHINYSRPGLNDLTFSSYGGINDPKPIIDGSIYHFDFEKENWDNFEIIKGVKFFKKNIKALELVENVYSDDQMLTLAREPDDDETVITGMKNSYTGYFKIDSVDAKYPKKIFYDHSNSTDWGDAELITRFHQWCHEVLKFSNSGSKLTLKQETLAPFKKDYGYFIQRSYHALDKVGEWFYDENKGILYFSPKKNKCTIYISSSREENNSGFDINRRKGFIIEDLEFRNAKYGIKLASSFDLKIQNNNFRNSCYGIINKKTYLNNSVFQHNIIKNMRSYGIFIIGHDITINNNLIDSIGLSLGYDRGGLNDLDGIEIFGNRSVISNNIVKNTGYSGIRFFDAAGSKVINNYVENATQVLSDGGGIYSYHNMEGNKLIKGNTIINAYGNANGTLGTDHFSNGIYLDELSLHVRVDSNFVYNCGGGIYMQNSRSDTIVNNVFKNSNTTQISINHAGRVLNGGKLNPSNDPGFDPDTLSFIPKDYTWDKSEGLLYYKDKRNGVVYVETGNNYIADNTVYPDPDPEKYTFGFLTWQNIDDQLVYKLTSNNNFFYNNVKNGSVDSTSMYIMGVKVRDYYDHGKLHDNITNTLDKTNFKYLNKVQILNGVGAKYIIEK
ncbi:MAG: right-handed parallel beta-helix repeat-containing protein [Candidatus Delongbacteria bacterium]|jgi:parallel beta-helix repeat protein|nr:right-handed parallel beta-helix repeat-containing protein [Candidatus Delongbacteria bacterium]